MILVGSRALAYFIGEYRTLHDWDFILPLKEIHQFSVTNKDHIKYMVAKNEWKFAGRLNSGEFFEIEVADYNQSAMHLWERRFEFPQNSTDDMVSFGDISLDVSVPSYRYLAMMKRSHLYWNVHWEKNIADYHLIKKIIGNLDFLDGCSHTLTADHIAFYSLRLAENKAKWGETTTKLNMTNEQFFNKSEKIGRIFEHDDLHEAVKYYDVPLYQMCKINSENAMLDRTIFELFDDEQKMRLVREEAMAIALERRIIPKMHGSDPADSHDAYRYALRRICTNLTSGWFRDYAIEHWPQLAVPDVNYVDKFRLHFGLELDKDSDYKP